MCSRMLLETVVMERKTWNTSVHWNRSDGLPTAMKGDRLERCLFLCDNHPI